MRGSVGPNKFGEVLVEGSEFQGCQWYLRWGPQSHNGFGIVLGDGVQLRIPEASTCSLGPGVLVAFLGFREGP